jgi:hypothetical protein
MMKVCMMGSSQRLKPRKETEMDRKFLVLFLLGSLFFVAGESPAASQPPAKICAQLVDTQNPANLLRVILIVKSAGSLKVSDGTVNSYTVNGFAFSQPGAVKWNYPIAGTGFMNKAKNEFDFSLVGSTLFAGTFFSASLFGYWDVADKNGAMIGDFSGTKGGVTGDQLVIFMMAETSCAAMEIPEPPTSF